MGGRNSTPKESRIAPTEASVTKDQRRKSRETAALQPQDVKQSKRPPQLTLSRSGPMRVRAQSCIVRTAEQQAEYEARRKSDSSSESPFLGKKRGVRWIDEPDSDSPVSSSPVSDIFQFYSTHAVRTNSTPGTPPTPSSTGSESKYLVRPRINAFPEVDSSAQSPVTEFLVSHPGTPVKEDSLSSASASAHSESPLQSSVPSSQTRQRSASCNAAYDLASKLSSVQGFRSKKPSMMASRLPPIRDGARRADAPSTPSSETAFLVCTGKEIAIPGTAALRHDSDQEDPMSSIFPAHSSLPASFSRNLRLGSLHSPH